MRHGKERAVTTVGLGVRANEAMPWWLPAIVAVGALMMGAGAVIALVRPAMLVPAASAINSAVVVYAGYMFARNLALAVMLLVTLGMGARRILSGLMTLTALVQLLDAGMDTMEGRWALVPGVLVFAFLFFLGAARLSGRALWKPAAWSDEA